MRSIPKSFQLGPHRIVVRLVSKTEMQAYNEQFPDGDMGNPNAPWGLYVQGENTIFLQKVRPGFNESQQIHTFWHEFYHALFAMLNENDLSTNEKLVDQCGLLHMHMLQTAKY